MNRITVVKVFVRDQDEALRFYTERLGFRLGEDAKLGDYRWLTVRAPGDDGLALNLELAKTAEERALVGRQGASQPLLALSTQDCLGDTRVLRARGVTFDAEPEVRPYGTGATFQDLYGNRLYLNQEPG